MSDIFTEEVAEEVAEEIVQPEEEVVALTEDQVATYLEAQGIDYKKAKNLSAWEKDTNAKASDLGRIAKELEAARESSKPAEENTLDADTQKELKAALKAVGLDVDSITNALKIAQTTVDEGREEAFESFVAAHDDVEPSKLIGSLIESGHDPAKLTPAALRRELNRAYKVIKADELDPEAIAKKAVDDYIAGLSKKGVKPDEVVEVKKGRGSAAGAHRNLDDVVDDPSVSFFDKMAMLQDLPE
jgi:hypothetical protein